MTSLLTRLLGSVVLTGAIAASASAESFLILRLAPTTTPASVAQKYKITLRDTTPNAPFALYAVANEAAGDRIQLQMLRDRGIVWAEDDAFVVTPESQARATVSPFKGGGVPAVGDRRGLLTYNAGALGQISWSETAANAPGRTVKMAILDTGLSDRVPALWSKVDASVNLIEPALPAYDLPRGHDSNRNGRVDEAAGHGTMVASIADQVAPQVRFVIARVADSDGNATAWTLVKGLAFAVTSGAEVANVSLGSLAGIAAISDVMDWCEEKNLLVVAAIGNNGVQKACVPAKISKVVGVAGLDPDNRKASFSNWDSSCDISAPATGFAAGYWDGDTATWSGTSFATPLVSGVIADTLRRTTRKTPDNVRRVLRSAGDSLDKSNTKYKGKMGLRLSAAKLSRAFNLP